MENASKALLIAGGILLAVLTITLVVYMMTSINSMSDAQDAKIRASQINKFNKEFGSYDKKRMYGTDVISVVNKAINHNKTVETQVEEPYYINIEIITNQSFITTYEKIDMSEANPKSEAIDYDDLSNEAKIEFGSENLTVCFETPGETYELGTWDTGGEVFITHSDFMSFFSGSKDDKEISPPDSGNNCKYKMYSALTNFKRAIFKCTGTGISEETGRINKMTFEQIQ